MNTLYSFFIWRCFAIAKEKDVLINEQIRAKEVLVIGPKGEQLGLKSREDALTLASVAGFDLVLMNANAEKPVCKLMDYNKFKYEKAKKMKEASKKQRENNTELKEYRLSVNIDIHDFNTRVKQASKYLEKGHRIKASIRFRGREMAHTELGKDVLIRFADALKEFGAVESVKAASDLLSPVSGTVVEVNEELEDQPEKINEDAFGNWIIKVKLSDPSELDNLMDAKAYAEMTK